MSIAIVNRKYCGYLKINQFLDLNILNTEIKNVQYVDYHLHQHYIFKLEKINKQMKKKLYFLWAIIKIWQSSKNLKNTVWLISNNGQSQIFGLTDLFELHCLKKAIFNKIYCATSSMEDASQKYNIGKVHFLHYNYYGGVWPQNHFVR